MWGGQVGSRVVGGARGNPGVGKTAGLDEGVMMGWVDIASAAAFTHLLHLLYLLHLSHQRWQPVMRRPYSLTGSQ